MAFLHEALFFSRLQFHSSFLISTPSLSFRCAPPIISNLSSPPKSSCAVKSTQTLLMKLSESVLSEYGGPGTLLVIPFIDMADTLNEKELPGGPQAAQAAIKWAQDHIDKDWKEWTGTE